MQAATLRAWRPPVPGITEVLHAHFPDHAYPVHTHDTWTLLIVDQGTVSFELGRGEHATDPARVTLLPPHVPHDGRSVTPGGFRKRVVYLEAAALDAARIGQAVDQPTLASPGLHRQTDLLHRALDETRRHPDDALEAESRLATVIDEVSRSLSRRPPSLTWRDPGLARELRELLDARLVRGITLGEASSELGAHPSHLVRVFQREIGMSPHRYLIGRRLDLARRLLLSGRRPADVAAEVGFCDQAHLTRHFKRWFGATPGAFSTGARAR